MKGLVEQPGKYRNQRVGIVKGSKIAHVAPPHTSVSLLMKDLFEYLKDQSELTLIKSCVFHYEMEFIHPFMDGNGRMGRLWQTLILMKAYPLFEFLPFESLISNNQSSYYEALALSDKAGKSTIFIEYMLGIIDKSLDQLLQQRTKKLNEIDRLSIFLGTMDGVFTRKEYMNFFVEISSATASRDLKNGVDMHILERYGEKKTTQYKKI
jgi:Fic family protein